MLLYLLIYCLNSEEMLDIWHSPEQSAVDSANDKWTAHLCSSVQAKGGHFKFWQYANWVSGHWSNKAMFQIRKMRFSNRLTIHKAIKSSAQLCHQELV